MSRDAGGEVMSTRPPSNLSENPTRNDGGSTDDSVWKIAVGVSVPLVLLIGVLIIVYVLYRRKYPVRMIIGREFSKVRNPNYDRPRSDATLVREDADDYFKAQMEAAAVGLNEYNPVNHTFAFGRENAGYQRDEDEYENVNDDDREEREFRLKKSWLFKSHSNEDVQIVDETETKTDADSVDRGKDGDSGSDISNVEAMLAEQKTTPIPTRKQLQANSSDEESRRSDSNASDGLPYADVEQEPEKATTIDAVDSGQTKMLPEDIDTDFKSVRSQSMTVPSIDVPSRPRSYSVDLNQSARNMSIRSHEVLSPDIFFHQLKFPQQSTDASLVSGLIQPRGSFYSSESSLSNHIREHAMSFSSVNSNPHLVTDLDDSDEDDVTMGDKSDVELDTKTESQITGIPGNEDSIRCQDSDNDHKDHKILERVDNEKSSTEIYENDTFEPTGESKTSEIVRDSSADQYLDDPIYENVLNAKSFVALNTDISAVKNRGDESVENTGLPSQLNRGPLDETENIYENFASLDLSPSSDTFERNWSDKHSEAGTGGLDVATEKQEQTLTVLGEHSSPAVEGPFGKEKTSGGQQNPIKFTESKNSYPISDQNELSPEQQQDISNERLMEAPKSLQKSGCENVSENVVGRTSLSFVNQNWLPQDEKSDLYENSIHLGRSDSDKFPGGQSIDSVNAEPQSNMSDEAKIDSPSANDKPSNEIGHKDSNEGSQRASFDSTAESHYQNLPPPEEEDALYENIISLRQSDSNRVLDGRFVDSVNIAGQSNIFDNAKIHSTNDKHLNYGSEHTDGEKGEQFSLDYMAESHSDILQSMKSINTPAVDTDVKSEDSSDFESNQTGQTRPLNNPTTLEEHHELLLDLDQSPNPLAEEIEENNVSDDSGDSEVESDDGSSTSRSSSDGHFEEYSFHNNELRRDDQGRIDYPQNQTSNIIATGQSARAESPTELGLTSEERDKVNLEKEPVKSTTNDFPITEADEINSSVSSQSGFSDVDDVSLSDIDEPSGSLSKTPKSRLTEEKSEPRSDRQDQQKDHQKSNSSSSGRGLKLVSAVQFSEGSSDSSDDESLNFKGDMANFKSGVTRDLNNEMNGAGFANAKEFTLEDIDEVLTSDEETINVEGGTAANRQRETVLSFGAPETFNFSEINEEDDIDV